MEYLEETFGVKGTFSYSPEYLDFEQYKVFRKETVANLALASFFVAIILLVVTMSFRLTLLVILCVLLTEFFLIALIHIWGLTFNAIMVVNLIVAIGFAVEYSLHIAYTYPKQEPPALKQYKTLTAKRAFMAKGALTRVGPSIFHSAFALLLGLSVLISSRSYLYEVFFKTWSGIIVFSLCNGMILLPVALYILGPTYPKP